ncbi:MAG: hypothetical protein RR144_01625 [Clostridia bacterium]
MFEKYYNEIKKMNTFEKKEILNKKFELYNENNMTIYYAPHNEILNNDAKIFIVGITPGWTQTSIAYKTAYNGIINNLPSEQIRKECKKNSRFAGSMKKNLIKMLDELNLNSKLNVNSCAEIFEDKDYLLHTTSIIPYPVFINGKNYTGSSPKIMENETLQSYAKKYFYSEIAKLSNTFIIPLGKAVEEVLETMINEGRIKREQCLLGFPHPSGANGHRKTQFNDNKVKLLSIIEKYFKEGGN